MGKKLVYGVITGVILLAMVFTCPKEQAHFDAVGSAYKNAIQEKVGILSDLVGEKSLQKWARGTVKVKDFFLFSIGSYSMNDESSIVSVGVFGHVFTFTKDNVLEEFSRSLGINI